MSETLPEYETAVNPPATPQSMYVYAILTDGEYVLDGRAVHLDDIPAMNALAQAETEGELQWMVAEPWVNHSQPDTRPLFHIASEAFNPLQVLVTQIGICQEYGRQEVDFAVMQNQVERLNAALKFIQRRVMPTHNGRIPALYFELGSGVECDPRYHTAYFECLNHALEFQEKYPRWRVHYTSRVNFELQEELSYS